MQAEPVRLVVGNEPDAVARARRFAIDRAITAGLSDLAADVELVTSELVTNGLLHAGPPVEVRITARDAVVRVEVMDTSRTAPVRAVASADAMTGRGLALVEAVAARWGAEQLPDGKLVWCEVEADAGEQPENGAAAERLIEHWAPTGETDTERRFVVRLPDVPTDLLLAAKAHVDNLVREFALAAAGAAASPGGEVPPQLAHLVENVVHRFAEARQSIRRQALEAAARGEERTELVLTLPESAAPAGEAYLAALDQADAYARAARLLTLETPPAHRVFRRWYVESLVDQLRHAAAGRTPPPSPTLERRLLDELGAVAAAHRASARAARVHAVAAALAGATTPTDVASIAVTEGVAVLGADRGALVLRSGTDHVTVPASVGHPEERLALFTRDGHERSLPVMDAIRTGEPVWVESRDQRDRGYPSLAEIEPTAVSLCAAPLRVGVQVVGALRFTFDTPHLFDDDERRFVLTLATQTAQALDRALLYAAERTARSAAESYAERLGRVQQVTAELAAETDIERIADIVVTHAADALGAQIATVSLLVDEDTLEVVRHNRAAGTADWERYSVHDATPAGEAVRTNRPVVVRTGKELDERFPAVAGQTSPDRTLFCVPMSVGERRIGVISLSFLAGHDDGDPTALGFVATLADACSQAIDRVRALEHARASADKLAFLAAASAELASTLNYRATLANIARLVVPRLADWCAVQLVDEGRLETVAVAHADPAKVTWAEELQKRYPTPVDAPTGVANVIRTGRGELYPTVTDEMLEASAVDEDHLRVLRELGFTSALIAPLTGRSATVGALLMIYAESGRHYDTDDLTFAEDLGRRAAVAVENAAAFRRQSGRLAAITRVAEAAQHAILAPVPERVGPVRLAAAYVSAAREALVGGDLYEVVARPDAVRLLVGDVRGKGLDAVRLATVVLGEFRAAAVERDSLADVAVQMDRRVTGYLADEDFVTAVIAEIAEDGRCRIACCGHPPALLFRAGTISEVGAAGSPPLGLQADPVPVEVALGPGDRLLLYTDGLVEARDARGRFADLDRMVSTLRDAPLVSALDRILATLREDVGGDLGDDLAMLLAEFDPVDGQVPTQPGASVASDPSPRR